MYLSVPPVNEQSTMTVTGFVCIYSLSLSVAVASAPDLYPLYFYLVSRFTVRKRGKQLCSNSDASRILNTFLSVIEKEFLSMPSTWNLLPNKRQLLWGMMSPCTV